jgi:hypothetical protein
MNVVQLIDYREHIFNNIVRNRDKISNGVSLISVSSVNLQLLDQQTQEIVCEV